MADMHDSGVFVFNTWAKQNPMPNGKVFYNQFLGEFNPNMNAEEANRRLDQVDKITLSAQQAFMRGWRRAQDEFLTVHPELAA